MNTHMTPEETIAFLEGHEDPDYALAVRIVGAIDAVHIPQTQRLVIWNVLYAELSALRADKARLDWLKEEPYARLQKVREWLPISYVPPAPDNTRAAIDNAMKHDPNYRP